MKRRALALMLTLLVSSSLIPLVVTEAQVPEPEVSFTYWDAPMGAITKSPTIIILFPQESETFSTNNVTLKVNVGSQNWVIDSVYYEADWQKGLHRIFTVQQSYQAALKVTITANFTEIPDGRHNITISANTHDGAHASSSVFFITDSSPPRISELSILNKTYNSQNIPLSFNFNENPSWVAYNLDNQGNKTIQGNVTLTGLSEGSHTIVVYANDTLGNMGKSDPVFFTVNTESIEDFTPAIVLSGVIAIVVALGLLVYFKLHKR